MDYQFLAPPQLWNAFKEVQGSSMLEEHQPLHVPPHIFARINAPGTYFYRPEPTGKRGTTWRRGLDDEDLKYVLLAEAKIFQVLHNELEVPLAAICITRANAFLKKMTRSSDKFEILKNEIALVLQKH